jgi:asparagine synthase (glutamine-hydrolysing)
MCGIAGFLNFGGHDKTPSDLIGMLTAIRYRGPDAMGVYIDDLVGLGHVRLSIIDLSGGNQPIYNEDKSIWVIYNGEIYNYIELRVDLEKRGHRFYTTTDTEVLVHLYEEYGTEFLNMLNGQWAFTLWNNGNKQLFIARDRVGVRPVFYATVNNTFFFGSEIKALFTQSEVRRQIDPVAIDQIFTFWTTLPGATFFSGITELKAGHYIVLERGNGEVMQRPYWTVPLYTRDEWVTDSPSEISERVRELLIDAVKIRLRADVPVGTYLSGGLDSSGVTAIVAKKFNPAVQTFGIRFEEGRFDEGEHQIAMVDFLGVKHHEMTATNAAIGGAFAAVVRHCEKPILRTAPAPLYLLSRMVRESGIIVVLTGEGADEFQGGYDIFKEALIRSFWARRAGSAWRGRLIERLYPDIFRDSRSRLSAMGFFGRGLDKAADPLFSHLLRWENTARIKTFLNEEIQASIAPFNGIESCRELLPDGFSKWHPLHKAQYLEICIFLSTYLLSSQGDRMGMAHSIEVRMPYLDHRLIDFMGRVPPWWKMCGLHEKHVLKKALQPFLPQSITARVKHPYRAPIHPSLLALVHSEAGQHYLSASQISRTGIFNPLKVDSLMRKLTQTAHGSETDSMALAGILSTQIIHHDFVTKPSDTAVHRWKTEVIIDKRTG